MELKVNWIIVSILKMSLASWLPVTLWTKHLQKQQHQP